VESSTEEGYPLAVSPKTPAIVFGTGDFARVASFYLDHDSPFEVTAFTVHERFRNADALLGRPVVPWERIADSHPPTRFALFLGVGYSGVNRNRAMLFAEARQLGYEVPSYVCSKATTWPGLAVGEGSFVFENNVLQPFTSIGKNTVLWSGNHIGHDTAIGDHVFIASHAVISGNCRIGDYTFIGVNATIRDGITIGERCVIGAGTVLLHDAPAGSVYKAASTPAAEIRSDALRRI